MSIKPLTETQKVRIVNNVVKAVKNIEALNKTGYGFIYLACGFIAHYNLNGFIHYYKHESSTTLKDDIIRNSRMNQWDNFRQGEQNYDYYMSKKDVYNRILAQI